MNVEGTGCQGVKCIQLIQDGDQWCLSKHGSNFPRRGELLNNLNQISSLKSVQCGVSNSCSSLAIWFHSLTLRAMHAVGWVTFETVCFVKVIATQHWTLSDQVPYKYCPFCVTHHLSP